MAKRGLAKLVERVRVLHEEELEPVSRSAHIPPGDVNVPSSSTKSQTRLGDRLEIFTMALQGGEHTGDRRLFVDGEDTGVKPDIIDGRRKIYWECKGCVSGSSCNFDTGQIDAYKALQLKKPGWRIFFAVYRHNLYSITKEERNNSQVTRDVSKGIFFSVVLPASIVFASYDLSMTLGNGEKSRLVYPHNGSTGYDPCGCIRSPTLNRFLSEPGSVIEELGLEVGDYRIRRVRSPSNMRLGCYKVAEFPIVQISDKNHRDWVGEFRETMNGQARRDEYEDMPI